MNSLWCPDPSAISCIMFVSAEGRQREKEERGKISEVREEEGEEGEEGE